MCVRWRIVNKTRVHHGDFIFAGILSTLGLIRGESSTSSSSSAKKHITNRKTSVGLCLSASARSHSLSGSPAVVKDYQSTSTTDMGGGYVPDEVDEADV